MRPLIAGSIARADEVVEPPFDAAHESGSGPIATEIHRPRNVGDQGKSGLVVLNVSFVAHDPSETWTVWIFCSAN